MWRPFWPKGGLMIEWYTFKPIDTLFFKGAQPMEIGQNHTASAIFPPAPQTISGALRTAYLKQNNVSFTDYNHGDVKPDVHLAIGKSGQKAPFQVIGPLFLYKKTVFVPTPYHWYTDKNLEKSENTIPIYKAKPLNTTNQVFKACNTQLLWAKGKSSELKTLGGQWMTKDLLLTQENQVTLLATLPNNECLTKTILDQSAFYSTEQRTGIALKSDRQVREGCLYSFTHYRLAPEVVLFFGVTQKLDLASNGVMMLGGEKRFGHYEKCSVDIMELRAENSQCFMALSAVESTKELDECLMAAGRPLYRGGWDMHKRFHKPLTGFYPAGSVFNKNLGDNFVALL